MMTVWTTTTETPDMDIALHPPTVTLNDKVPQRRRKWKPEYAQEIVRLAWLGCGDERIADRLGVNDRTLWRWAHKYGFADQLKEARDQADYRVVSALFAKACQGDVKAAQVWLAARQRAVWGAKAEVEVTHGVSDRMRILREGQQRVAMEATRQALEHSKGDET